MKPEDDIEYIVNSKSQFNILRTLYERSEPATKAELKNETDSSKPTIDRAIRNSTEKNWVEEKSRGRYTITTAGESIVESYGNFYEIIGETQTKTKLLNHLGDNINIRKPSIETLNKAETVEYPPQDPFKGWQRASDEVTNRKEELESYRGMNPIVSSKSNDIGREILSAVDEAELIIDEDVLEMSESNHSEAMREGLTADNLDIYVSPDNVPITLAIYDEKRIEISIHDEDGHPAGGIRGSNGDLICWATDLYEQYRQQSYPLTELLNTSD